MSLQTLGCERSERFDTGPPVHTIRLYLQTGRGTGAPRKVWSDRAPPGMVVADGGSGHTWTVCERSERFEVQPEHGAIYHRNTRCERSERFYVLPKRSSIQHQTRAGKWVHISFRDVLCSLLSVPVGTALTADGRSSKPGTPCLKDVK
ncbi:uncharacterized protein LOC124113194 [Haliotis rufescens]|uniref:uncharacterized protein LOC124113194 n=1 Tax=Haliotis rufescens TaxID=6454 RepID=UPI00201EC59B|nr:uncharacterized protein LOC124113194 [Haliotis rufescens]